MPATQCDPSHRPFPNNTTSTVCTRMFRSSKKLRCFT